MATKKASSSKIAPKKRPSTKKPVKAVVKPTTVAAKTGGKDKKLTFSDKAVAIRPGMLIAEFFGTFVLTGAVINLAGGGLTGSIAIALILATLMIVLGVISGGHFNPAITIAQYVNRKIDGVRAAAYICAQILGALAAFGLLLGMFNASAPSLETQVYDTLTSSGYETAENINDGGGIVKYLEEEYGMTIEDAAEQLGIDADTSEFINHEMTADKEWVDLLLELVAAIVFGLGIGYAVYSEKKSSVENGLAVGVSLLAGLVIGGSSVILNPAVAAAIGGLEALVFTGNDALAFWWSISAYIGATIVGLTAGFTLYKLALKDVLAKK